MANKAVSHGQSHMSDKNDQGIHLVPVAYEIASEESYRYSFDYFQGPTMNENQKS